MTPAIKLLQQKHINHLIHEYSHEPSTRSYGLEAAEKLGLAQDRVFKTLVVQLNTGKLCTAVVPVSSQLNMKQLAKCAQAKKADLADPKLVEKTTGYVLGGVSPLGQKKLLPTFIHNSAHAFTSIYVSAGKRGLEIEIDPTHLADLVKGCFVDIAS